MNEIIFPNKYNQPICLALGFFDCVHIGHRQVISAATNLAKTTNSSTAVATFIGNPSVNGSKSKPIYTYAQRCALLQSLNVDTIISIDFDTNFMQMPAQKYLDILSCNYDIQGIVCGFDYRFGHNLEGDSHFLRAYFEPKNIPVFVVGQVSIGQNKVSSTYIKELLIDGLIEMANNLLVSNYAIRGRVERGRGVGHTIGAPTANIKLDNSMIKLGNGVYGTRVHFQGNIYHSVTNIGGRPTFDNCDEVIETYIHNFDQNIYDKDIDIEFVCRIRDTIKFDKVSQLVAQIRQDILWEN